MRLKYKDRMKCDLVCCGHTHFPTASGTYFNSGSWTELPATYLLVDNGKVDLKCWSDSK